MPAAYALGSALAAIVFASVLGFGALLIGNRTNKPGRRLRRLGAALARYLTLWFALALLGLAHMAGFGPWPRRPLTGTDALSAITLACLAFLPHLLCNTLGSGSHRAGRSNAAA